MEKVGYKYLKERDQGSTIMMLYVEHLLGAPGRLCWFCNEAHVD